MPNPATVQATMPVCTGTCPASITASPPIPASMTTRPILTRRLASHLAFILACTQAPAVQARVAPVTASPASTGLRPRTIVIVNVTNASAPKNVKVSSDRLRIVAGSPRTARSVPGGSRRRSAGSPAAKPAATSAKPASTGHGPCATAVPPAAP